MNIDLKPYQERAVGRLVDATKKLLSRDEQKKVCVLKAPTGSGKTIITAKFIENLIKELYEEDLCFIWVSVGIGELHLQSKHSLEKIFGGSPHVSLVEEEFNGGREVIMRNEVVVVNWEKLRSKDHETGEWKSILMKDREKINFREVLFKTREQRKIVLVIDESHFGAAAERTSELRDEISADVILEVSATPAMKPDLEDIARGIADFVLVESKDVIKAGVIKKELIINEKINEISTDEMSSQEIILEAAYQKRLALKALFEAESSSINPLVLIQIPTAEAGKEKQKAVEKFLEKKGIVERKNGYGNGKLAIWLADWKSETLDEVAEQNNEIEFLIFKQAINTGWDCPRAHILVRFREPYSEQFAIQTVGRILRMPELRHYAHEDLNRGFIFTNVQSINVEKEEYNPNIIKHLKATRKNSYQNIALISYYKEPINYSDMTLSFISFNRAFEETACKKLDIKSENFFGQNIKILQSKGVTVNLEQYQQEIISNTAIETQGFDELEGSINPEQKIPLNTASDELESMFTQIIESNLRSFRNAKRSLPKVRTSIYIWFEKYLGAKNWPEKIAKIQSAFLHNRNVFEPILVEAVTSFKEIRNQEIQKHIERNEQFYEFDIRTEDFYNAHENEQFKARKYVYEPCYLNSERSQPEKEFEQFLEKNADKITWWWKNGVNKRDCFGIKYFYPEYVIHTFYPDYLVQFTNKQIGIFEVKDKGDRDGHTFTRAKAEQLQEYIKTHNVARKTLFGGIVIYKNGAWKINQQAIYRWDKCELNDWSEWQDLDELV